jgi:hypothetical protein
MRNYKLNSPEFVSAARGELDNEIELRWDPVRGAISYAVEMCRNKKNHWQMVDIVSKSRYTVTNLKWGATYHFRVAALNNKNQGPWSEVITEKC